MQFPTMQDIKLTFPHHALPDVARAVREQLMHSNLKDCLVPGQRVGITAGSRGINNIVTILKEVITYIKELSAEPLIIAAMGSHGGGTADGQKAILSSLGITPAAIGAPVYTGSACRPVGSLEDSVPLYATEIACQCDAIIVINRIKPHTSFHGPAESGLQKMLAIGLGGPRGAKAIHSFGARLLPRLIPSAARIIMQKLPVVMGLAILEDAHEDTMQIVALKPDRFVSGEQQLLSKARSIMPCLTIDHLDLLIVEYIGKNFSGTGMDTNIIGRMRIHGVPEPTNPDIQRIVALDISKESGGNATGIGLADFTTQRLVGKINMESTILNVMTSTFIQRAMLPITLPDDRAAISIALNSIGNIPPASARVMQIKNTLHLNIMRVSENLLPELRDNPLVETTGPSITMQFDGYNNLLRLP
ncbi:lactate racemase domain-containing protein [Desulfoscipio gibsoniae]|uniref:LarA-like N-terminal domain-containing protein n=1 Tax=Desulfoscipio gibsoniae DSM 7213 TaxID=767817 RepID=R4KK67_9FIRM|nr:lactate racemase domain-containing protein [Desulfoscipio gibsoniae]AGL00950.1 hypothetical protein Desgi_1453 [Desulfoscipio gibsoniae DSM 7213]